MTIRQVKDTIRDIRQPDQPATKDDVQSALGENENAKDALQSYQRAKKLGEIYEFPEDGTLVVKITDEAGR